MISPAISSAQLLLFDMSVFLQIKGFREVGIPREVFGALFVVHMRMRIGTGIAISNGIGIGVGIGIGTLVLVLVLVLV